ncbi:hypothetical protein Pmani_024923 [Petrolisthes manimaculis]|uniref:ABC1 atypical kinase-like domain-containing protein n=1 Tax=Petrolisthes manimaculis TaxID=1843537 RepID=A0AAE1P8T1_9EUCA|nr:hypothetical protein Pmani_024923 [Petrolisthes manimaculis]
MARAPRGSDLMTVLRGLARVGSAAVEIRSQEVNRAWATSSLRPTIEEGSSKIQEAMSTLQQPQTLQHEASKVVNEAVARFSMVTEGIKAYRGTSAAPHPAPDVSAKYDPLYDPSVQELNIEEMMMKEATSGHSDLSNQYTEVLVGAQLVADNLTEGARGTKEELNMRLSEFEPLLDITKVEEKEITDEHLQAIDETLSEVTDVAYGHKMDIKREAEQHKFSEDKTEGGSGGIKEASQTTASTAQSEVVPEMSIEMVMMQETVSGQDNLTNEYAEVLSGAQTVADTLAEGAKEVKEEVDKRFSGFEPLLDITKVEEKEITDEHLQAIDETLSEVQSVAYGHKMDIKREAEQHKLSENKTDGESGVIKEASQTTVSTAQNTEILESDVEKANNGAKTILESEAVPEMSIEMVMMQETVSGQDNLTNEYAEVLSGAQTVADTLAEGAKEVKEEVDKRFSGFEPLLDISKIEEKEITDEHLQAIDETLSEVQSVAYGQHLELKEESGEQKLTEEAAKEAEKHLELKEESGEQKLTEEAAKEPEKLTEINDTVSGSPSLVQEPETMVTRNVTEGAKEMSVEDVMMQEILSEQNNQVTNEDILSLHTSNSSDFVENVSKCKEDFSSRLEKFEPLLDVTQMKEEEITEDHLEALDDKLSELQDVAFGHNLKIFKEVEHSKPMEEVLKDVQEQCLTEEGKEKIVSSSLLTEMQNVSQVEESGVVVGQVVSVSQSSKGSAEATDPSLELDISLSQVAKPVYVEEESCSVVHTEVSIESQIITNIPDADGQPSNAVATNSAQMINVNPELIAEVEVPPSKVTSDTICGEFIPVDSVEKTSRGTESSSHVSLTENKDAESAAHMTPVNTESVIPPVESGTADSVTVGAFDKVDEVTQVHTDSTVNEISKAVESSINATSTAGTAATTIATSATATTATSTAATVADAAAIPITASAAATTTTAAAVAAAAATTAAAAATTATTGSNDIGTNTGKENTTPIKPKPKLIGKKPLAKDKPKSRLAETAQARKVPHSRLGRLMSFGGLAAGLGVGTVAEVTRRRLGINQGKGAGSLLDGSPFLTEANAKRIVDTLCKVRGAALKLGQMMSIQDSSLINPQLQKIFERVRQSADFMPNWQLERAVSDQLGEEWRTKVATFDERPFAAASIGQVHLATLHDGRSVAMKIQYPGVAEGIESDINNLITTLRVASILPEGLFVDSIIEVAKRELGWECDYEREAECTHKFRKLVEPHSQYYVPEVIPQLCSQQIFTTELIDGLPVDKCVDLDQDTRNFLCQELLRLCLMELFQFGFMQTDPNWSNFFYNVETEQVALLDFGACRDYSKDFVDKYIHLIHGAATKDRQKVLKYSQELGFLNGYEAKVMENAHIDAIMILGEAFQEDKPFNFGDQNTTQRIQHLVPVMLSHRMCAPPEESYSLHRKMSGVFLLCTKLNAVVNCYRIFQDIYEGYQYGGSWEEFQSKVK